MVAKTRSDARECVTEGEVVDEPKSQQPTDRVTVLIVDDEPDLADLYEMWLADSYDTAVAYTGTEAIERIEECEYDIVLLDRLLSDVSGDDILVNVDEMEQSCKVAMLTAVKPDVDIIQMPCDGYVTKPVTRDELRGVVDRLVRISQYPPAVQTLHALVEKRSALRSHAPSSTIESNHEYSALEDSIARGREAVEETFGEVPTAEFPTLSTGLPSDNIATD